MNFLGQFLPGFRRVRAPLFSGYLWLFAAWLLLGEGLPKADEEVYVRVFEMAEAVGPVGLAIVASVAAYLLGSLVQAVIASLGYLLAMLKRTRGRRTWFLGLLGPVAFLDLQAAPFFAPIDIDWFDGDRETRSRLWDLASLKLGSKHDRLWSAIRRAEEKVTKELAEMSVIERERVHLSFEPDFGSGPEPVVRSFILQGPEGFHNAPPREKLELPMFSAARDIFEERAAIKTLLVETTQQAGAEVERLYAEAELRFFLALPLIAVISVMAAQSHDGTWWFLLVLPAGLLLHAMVLNKHGGREMIEALRSRDSDELRKITPVFDRYNERAEQLAAAIERFAWQPLATAYRKSWESQRGVSTEPVPWT